MARTNNLRQRVVNCAECRVSRLSRHACAPGQCHMDVDTIERCVWGYRAQESHDCVGHSHQVVEAKVEIDYEETQLRARREKRDYGSLCAGRNASERYEEGVTGAQDTYAIGNWENGGP